MCVGLLPDGPLRATGEPQQRRLVRLLPERVLVLLRQLQQVQRLQQRATYWRRGWRWQSTDDLQRPRRRARRRRSRRMTSLTTRDDGDERITASTTAADVARRYMLNAFYNGRILIQCRPYNDACVAQQVV